MPVLKTDICAKYMWLLIGVTCPFFFVVSEFIFVALLPKK